MTKKSLDIVLLGATGFTGGLTADYLAAHGPADLRWAIAGRNPQKLQAVAERLAERTGSAPPPKIHRVDLADASGLTALAMSTRAMATTVGPYARYGEPVTAACVEGGADYLDITGEPEFVQRIRRVYGPGAAAKGLRLVSCCGFDSIPHDFGALYAVRELGSEGPIRLEGVVSAQGTFSGGTWQSAVEAMGNLLRPGGKSQGSGRRSKGSEQPDGRKVRPLSTGVRYERRVKGWVAPLPTIDPVIVLRSAKKVPDFGPDFRYAHLMRVGSLPKLVAGSAMVGGIFALAQLPPTRKMLLSVRSPGDGPDAETREKSHFRVTFLGRSGKKRVITEVRGGDPGYGETSKMLAESALCMALDRDRLPERFGHLTPVAGLGDPLLERLRKAGIEFRTVEGP